MRGSGRRGEWLCLFNIMILGRKKLMGCFHICFAIARNHQSKPEINCQSDSWKGIKQTIALRASGDAYYLNPDIARQKDSENSLRRKVRVNFESSILRKQPQLEGRTRKAFKEELKKLFKVGNIALATMFVLSTDHQRHSKFPTYLVTRSIYLLQCWSTSQRCHRSSSRAKTNCTIYSTMAKPLE